MFLPNSHPLGSHQLFRPVENKIKTQDSRLRFKKLMPFVMSNGQSVLAVASEAPEDIHLPSQSWQPHQKLNQTLKQILQQAVEKKGTNWDLCLPYVLLTIQKKTQVLTGFSLFKHMRATKKNQQRFYNWPAQPQEFYPGNEVHLLLLNTSCRFLACWQGPYTVLLHCLTDGPSKLLPMASCRHPIISHQPAEKMGQASQWCLHLLLSTDSSKNSLVKKERCSPPNWANSWQP